MPELICAKFLDRTERTKKLSMFRYTDDFLIDIKGNRSGAERIKRKLTDFISVRLKLELSNNKAKTTHSLQRVHFLGYDVIGRMASRMSNLERVSNAIELSGISNV